MDVFASITDLKYFLDQPRAIVTDLCNSRLPLNSHDLVEPAGIEERVVQVGKIKGINE